MSGAQSPVHRFVSFGPDHLGVLGVTLLGVVALIVSRERLRHLDDRRLRWVVAVGLVSNELLSWPIGLTHGHVRLPLQLCDLALVVTAWALVSLRPRASELAYFWGLAGSLQAVLTPDLREPFPTYWWLKFFIGHCGVVLSVVYLALTRRVEATPRSIWRVWGWTNVYAVAAGLINWRFGTNLGYLAHKPLQPSLLDYFGPWPFYIVALEATALASFALYYVPFACARPMVGRTA